MFCDVPFALLAGSDSLIIVSGISQKKNLCCCNKQSPNLNGLTQNSTQDPHKKYSVGWMTLCAADCSDSANQPALTL